MINRSVRRPKDVGSDPVQEPPVVRDDEHGAGEGKLGLGGKTSGHVMFFQAPLGFSVRYRNLGNLFNSR